MVRKKGKTCWKITSVAWSVILFSSAKSSWSERRKSSRRSSGIKVEAWGRCNTIEDVTGTNYSVIGRFAFSLEPPFWQQSNLLAKTKVLSIFGSWKRRFEPLAGALQVQLKRNPNSWRPALLNRVERVFLSVPPPIWRAACRAVNKCC